MPAGSNPRRPVHIHAGIATAGKQRLAGMQAHPHPYSDSFRPGMFCQAVLRLHGAAHCLGGTRKGHEKGVPLRIDLLSVPMGKCSSQKLALLFQDLGIALVQLLKQSRRAFDIGE